MWRAWFYFRSHALCCGVLFEIGCPSWRGWKNSKGLAGGGWEVLKIRQFSWASYVFRLGSKIILNIYFIFEYLAIFKKAFWKIFHFFLNRGFVSFQYAISSSRWHIFKELQKWNSSYFFNLENVDKQNGFLCKLHWIFKRPVFNNQGLPDPKKSLMIHLKNGSFLINFYKAHICLCWGKWKHEKL